MTVSWGGVHKSEISGNGHVTLRQEITRKSTDSCDFLTKSGPLKTGFQTTFLTKSDAFLTDFLTKSDAFLTTFLTCQTTFLTKSARDAFNPGIRLRTSGSRGLTCQNLRIQGFG